MLFRSDDDYFQTLQARLHSIETSVRAISDHRQGTPKKSPHPLHQWAAHATQTTPKTSEPVGRGKAVSTDRARLFGEDSSRTPDIRRSRNFSTEFAPKQSTRHRRGRRRSVSPTWEVYLHRRKLKAEPVYEKRPPFISTAARFSTIPITPDVKGAAHLK